MTKEQGEILQKAFEQLSEEQGIRASFAYFLGDDNQAMLAWNGVNDNEMMYMISQLVARIAVKNKTTFDDVLSALSDGFKQHCQEAPKN